MAILDFPPSPAIGTLYPNPAVQGQPQYTYDGEKWVSGTGGGAIYISDSAPAAPVGSLWWESDTSILYVRYFDGDSTQWCQVLNGPADAVRFGTVQTLTEPQKLQARSNIWAAPIDVIGYSGLQLNGECAVSLQYGGAGSVANGYIPCDMWYVYSTTTAVTALAQYGPNTFFPGLSYYAGMTVTTAGTPTASTYVFLRNVLEGFRTARLMWGTAAAQPVTLSFWTGHSKVGQYSVSIRNGTFDRSYVVTYTQNVANAAEFKTFVIPGCTTGTWGTGTSLGIEIDFTFACGNAVGLQTTTPYTWLSSGCISAVGQVNGCDSTANTMRVTGLLLIPGVDAPTLERAPYIIRPYEQELMSCMRYYEIASFVVNTGSASIYWNVPWKVQKRSIPTLTATFDGGTGATFAATSSVVNNGLHGIYCGGGHSNVATATVRGDARIA